MIRDEIIKAAEEFQIQLNEIQLNQLIKFYDLVIDWNTRINLTAITEPRDFAIKNVIDSISACKAINDRSDIKIIDVGSGAGFPAVPLKIIKPEWKFTLIDSLNKRIKFLQAVKDELNFCGFECIHGRAEELSRQSTFREQYDIAISRAVAHLQILAELCIPFVKVGGVFVAMKGKNYLNEVEESRRSVKTLGGADYETVHIKLPEIDDVRVLLTSEKIHLTEKRYPRAFVRIQQQPL